MRPRTLIVRTAGTNCDRETVHAFELAGSQTTLLHIKRLMESPMLLEDFEILAIPGGFSYGDDIAAGRIFANQIRLYLREPLLRFIDDGKPIIGICNGFQVLVKTDLLPGPIEGTTGQSCTLTSNDCGTLVDRWIYLSSRSTKCIWTAGLETFELPVAHGEGKFVPRNEQVRKWLWESDRVALVYVNSDGSPVLGKYPLNPNGSVDDIAGICDETGLVLGLMPHPERFVSIWQHPGWCRADSRQECAGLRIMRRAIEHARHTKRVLSS